MLSSLGKATHKGFRAGREHSETNVGDIKVSCDNINVREFKMLNVSMCVHTHVCESYTKSSRAMLRFIAVPKQTGEAAECAHPALSGPH